LRVQGRIKMRREKVVVAQKQQQEGRGTKEIRE
jgi:hypothetical protein